jgi:cell division septum initiation protein DivIVA
MTSEPRRPAPGERAADIAAREVERLLEAAQAAADELRAEAHREVVELRRKAVEEADELRDEARAEADAGLEAARKKAIQLGDDARREAERRVADAQRVADEALAEARALSRGLRQLGTTLTEHAERILRDVQTGHRTISASLRAAGGTGSAPRAEREPRRPPRVREEEGAAPSPRPRAGSPFEDLDVPSWVER